MLIQYRTTLENPSRNLKLRLLIGPRVRYPQRSNLMVELSR